MAELTPPEMFRFAPTYDALVTKGRPDPDSTPRRLGDQVSMLHEERRCLLSKKRMGTIEQWELSSLRDVETAIDNAERLERDHSGESAIDDRLEELARKVLGAATKDV